MKDIKLYNDDCLEVMKAIPDKSIDMVLCDLPYSINTTASKWDKEVPLDKLWIEYKRIVKINGAIVLFAQQPFSSKLVMSNYENYKHMWVWNKKAGANFAQCKNHPLKIHEDILVFGNGKGRVNYYPKMSEGKMRVKGNSKTYNENRIINITQKTSKNNLYYPKSILEDYSNAGRTGKAKKIHPTQKNVELLKYLIETYTTIGETILDNTMGSGSTGVAAIELGRKFIGIEKDKEWFNKANIRIKDTYGEVEFKNSSYKKDEIIIYKGWKMNTLKNNQGDYIKNEKYIIEDVVLEVGNPRVKLKNDDYWMTFEDIKSLFFKYNKM